MYYKTHYNKKKKKKKEFISYTQKHIKSKNIRYFLSKSNVKK